MKAILKALIEHRPLTRAEAAEAIDAIVGGEAAPEHIGGLLIGLQLRGATLDEIVGFASAMRAHARAVRVERADPIDICGTGGDGGGTFNISTAVAFVVAGAGAAVAKHGNRAVSSDSGSTDVLGALGINAALEPSGVEAAIAHTGLGFLSAPHFHPSMKRLAEIRRSLGVRTVFNLLGPLTNPAGVRHQLMGVFDRSLLVLAATALGELGTIEAMVVAGDDGLDEITLTGKTHVAHLKDGAVRTYTLEPGDAGLTRAPAEALRGEGPAGNARIILDVLAGVPGPRRDVVLLNAAAALMIVGRARDLPEGVRLAAESIDSGRALDVLYQHRGAPSVARSGTILDEIADSARARVDRSRERESFARLAARAGSARTPLDFRAAFAGPGPHIIAEVKLASPSEGDIAPGADAVAVASDYLAHGAAAISVVTEPHYFKGDVSSLDAIRARHPTARLLMKDFIVDEYQLLQARAHGADAALILLAMLDEARARSLFAYAVHLGLTPLVEVHDEAEMALATSMGATLIGVNNRNLKTMQVSLDASERLAALAPKTAILISESGIRTTGDLTRLTELGYRGFLVGTHLMASGAPGKALAALLGAAH